LSAVSQAEEHRALVAWNDTRHPYDGPAVLHELVEAQVRRTPEAIAAAFEDAQLTFAELDAPTVSRAGCDRWAFAANRAWRSAWIGRSSSSWRFMPY
jgi:hypothetical protein